MKINKITTDPCPCGNDVLEIQESFLEDDCEVRCGKCGRSTGSQEDRQEAIAAWNRHIEMESK